MMNKDYIKPDHDHDIQTIKNKSGKVRKNRLIRDFYSDISIRIDQQRNNHLGEDQHESFNPHDYL